ncbi:hypothetical protein L211DRAFT_844633 [Terfezia boudieri ATCC MYA-4762]|uniref:Uncharacterized protein n=1 Tax=Terfezia boudieri ATCC MYA-4762 TaxID=1051890 RepID=A0A3N4M3G9_9PEZI|nr:hypothetical protein L211DRAFT_844633 [Terfezia boudieri ATCC MYA-4762]
MEEPPLELWPFATPLIISGEINTTDTWGPSPVSVFNRTNRNVGSNVPRNPTKNSSAAHNLLRTSKMYFQNQLGLFATAHPWQWFAMNRLAILVAADNVENISAQKLTCQLVNCWFAVLNSFNGELLDEAHIKNSLSRWALEETSERQDNHNEDPNASFSFDEDDEGTGRVTVSYTVHEAAALLTIASRLFLYAKDGIIFPLAPQVTLFLIYRLYVTITEYLGRAGRVTNITASIPLASPPTYNSCLTRKSIASQKNEEVDPVDTFREPRPLKDLSVNNKGNLQMPTSIAIYSVTGSMNTREYRIQLAQVTAGVRYSHSSANYGLLLF